MRRIMGTVGAPAGQRTRSGHRRLARALDEVRRFLATPAQPCAVASANTLGNFRCTREAFHDGPCAAEEVEHERR